MTNWQQCVRRLQPRRLGQGKRYPRNATKMLMATTKLNPRIVKEITTSQRTVALDLGPISWTRLAVLADKGKRTVEEVISEIIQSSPAVLEAES